MSDVTKPINLASEVRRLEPFVGHAARYIAFIDGNTQVQVPLGDVRTVAAVFAALTAASVPPDRERMLRDLEELRRYLRNRELFIYGTAAEHIIDKAAAILRQPAPAEVEAAASRLETEAYAMIGKELQRLLRNAAALLRRLALPAVGDWRPTTTKAAQDVLTERNRQIIVEGWAPGHDDQHTDGSLAIAAACYIIPHIVRRRPGLSGHLSWPWDWKWFKPDSGDRRRSLVKAGALILAEIERLDRLPAPPIPEETKR